MLLHIVIRVVFVYAYFAFLVRVLGKREIGTFSPIDFVVALVLGDLAGDVIFNDATLVEGAVAAGTLALAHFANATLSYHIPFWDRIVGGKPTLLVKDGIIQEASLRAQRMNRDELYSHLREVGIDEPDLQEISAARLETDGRITVILKPEERSARRKDLKGS
ncbi:MAG TPA: YetF domain-containing protein [Thermoanaerobaculia bacterium]|nr:YetF domain-containing protein [Thermoanaerobaculia bacterium]